MSGRKCNKNFHELKFDLVKVNDKHAAKCTLCGYILKNTGSGRLQGHRNICNQSSNEKINANNQDEIKTEEQSNPYDSGGTGSGVNMSVKKGKKQWTVEECSNLIEAYRQHPNLWNTSHVNYKNRLKKYVSLKEIAELFGTNYEEIERKLKNIISQYQRERRTYKKLKKSGYGHVFKPKWFGYASMCFLQQKNKPINDSQIGLEFEGSSSSSSEDSDNANEGETCELDGNILDVQLKVEPLEQYTEEESESQKTEETSQMDTKERRTSQHLYSAPNIVKKPSKLADSSNMSSISEDTFNMIKSVYQEAQRTETRDKYTIFGELVSHTIRNLKTDYSKATVEHLISNILYQAQIGAYDYPQHSTVPCSYTTSSSSNRDPSSQYTAETHTDNPTTVTSDM